MSDVIHAENLVKTFGHVRALDGVNLTVNQGEIHGFLGPNGAGKSTAIRVLLGLLRADSGTVRLLDGDPFYDAVDLHRRLAYVPGDVELWPELSGGEAIDLLARLRGGLDHQRRNEFMDRFELDPTKKGRTYSKGNRQKVAIVAALASDVELLLLDEPTAGLDPLMGAIFEETMREAKAAGKTVLLSSHILSQVEALADKVSIIRKGRIVESGTLTELRHFTRTTMTVETAEPSTRLSELPGVYDLERKNGKVEFDVDPDHLDGTVRYLSDLGIRSLVSHPPTIEQLFMRHYGDQVESEDGTVRQSDASTGADS